MQPQEQSGGKLKRQGRCCADLFCPFEAIAHVEPIRHRKEVHGCQYVGTIKLPAQTRKSEKHDRGLEQLLGLAKDCGYEPSYWDERNYTRALEKHSYAKGRPLSEAEHLDADWVLADEYYYMYGSKPVPVTLTTKNHKSHPGVPVRYYYKTEIDFISQEGMRTYGHVEDVFSREPRPYLFYGFLKSELVKVQKNADKDTRMIQCPPCTVNRMAARFEQEQNQRMKDNVETCESQVGWSPLMGGLDKTLSRFVNCHNFLELDWTRYDGTIPDEIFDKVGFFRASALYCTDKEYRTYVNYRSTLLQRLTALPTGDVIVIPKGNPSGQFSTSADNCMVQTVLVFLETKAWLAHNGVHLSNRDVRQCYATISYGDDRLTGYLPGDYEHLFPPATDWLAEFYRSTFGMWVKPENVKTSRRLEGLTFCGINITKQYGVYVPVYKSEKLYTSLCDPVQPSSTVDELEQKYNNIRALVALGKGDRETAIRECAQVLSGIDPNYKPLTDFETDLLVGGPKFCMRKGANTTKTVRWISK
uniref:Non-structural polyprotein 1AB n=1 Tax=Eviota astrovirus TaxID=3156503 RepID=A0AAU7BB46_9VIRU